MAWPDETPQQPLPRKYIVSIVVALTLLGVTAFASLTAHNAFGENISGSVRCANPQHGTVTGVFIEADRFPRLLGGHEIQSGFAFWQFRHATDVADFTFWLPYGGKYSVHFGCGSAAPGEWGSDNRTPLMAGSGHFWQCNNPSHGESTVVASECKGG
jgi:hypothetical protein